MDLRNTQEVAEHFNRKRAEYEALYSEYVQCAVNLHNYHQQMLRKPLYSLKVVLRKHLREIIAIEKKMMKVATELCKAKKADLRARQYAQGKRRLTLEERGQENDKENNWVIRNKKK